MSRIVYRLMVPVFCSTAESADLHCMLKVVRDEPLSERWLLRIVRDELSGRIFHWNNRESNMSRKGLTLDYFQADKGAEIRYRGYLIGRVEIEG